MRLISTRASSAVISSITSLAYRFRALHGRDITYAAYIMALCVYISPPFTQIEYRALEAQALKFIIQLHAFHSRHLENDHHT